MLIPTTEQIKLPLLRLVADGREFQLRDIVPSLADHFSLTDEERNELLPSGRIRKFYNRCNWAQHGLKSEGLLESPRRGYHRITDRGREFLNQNSDDPPTVDNEVCVQTPEESIEENYHKIRERLVVELLEQIMNSPPVFLENLVIDLLVQMGYGGSREDAEAVGRSGDGGIDGVINEDRLGLDVIYVQAKRWEANVGQPEIFRFSGALRDRGARKGIFITTSGFTRRARDAADNSDDPKIVLIDGRQLAEYMIDYDVGVSTMRCYKIKRVDSDYFDED
jgi:restriction system protein